MRHNCHKDNPRDPSLCRSILSQVFPLNVLLLTLPIALVSCQGPIPKQDTPPPQAHDVHGVSLVLQQIDTYGDDTTVNLKAINGSDDSVKLSDSNDPILLRDETGKQYLAAEQDVELQPHTHNDLKIHFLGVPRASKKLSLITNSKYGNQYSSPRFTLQELPRRAAFADYQPRTITFSNVVVYHPNGLSLALKQANYTQDGVEISFDAVNGSEDEISLNNSGSDRPFLQDSNSTRYFLVPDPVNPDLKIPARQKLSGTLRFAGQIPATPGTLSLRFNDKFGGDQDYSDNPKVVIPDLAVTGTAVTPADGQGISPPTDGGSPVADISPVATASPSTANQKLDLQVNHANGSVLRATGISLAEDSVTVDFAITNGYREQINLNNSKDLILRDDLGNPYNLSPPPQNPLVDVAVGATLRGKFVFLGRVAPTAKSLNLITNEKNGGDQDSSTHPKMTITDIPIQR